MHDPGQNVVVVGKYLEIVDRSLTQVFQGG